MARTRRDAWRSFREGLERCVTVINIDGQAYFTEGRVEVAGTQRLAVWENLDFLEDTDEGRVMLDGVQPVLLLQS